MTRRVVALVLPLALGIGACGQEPLAPRLSATAETPLLQQNGRPQRGTGLALENVVGGLPLVGDIQITQVVITEFSTFLGGLQASGTITGTSVSVPGLTVTDDFTADVLISSTSGGRCDLVTIDLAPIDVDLLGLVTVDVPVANISGQGSGAIGPLLCNLGRLVDAVGGGVIGGLVNALNALLR
jgi:hypothetical protein